MKVAISVPDSLFEAAEDLRKELEISRSGLYSRALQDLVATYTAGEVRESLAAVYGSEDSNLDPSLERLQAEALREEW